MIIIIIILIVFLILLMFITLIITIRPVEAMEDADKALAHNKLSTKAIIAKVNLDIVIMMMMMVMNTLSRKAIIAMFNPHIAVMILCQRMMVILKAEALYNMGEFERALVQYERGTRVRKVITMIIISLTMIIRVIIVIITLCHDQDAGYTMYPN